ncbi:hypothetical protein HC031_04235 [Planosporangium thailandense]|uniref:VapC45 PIN like domain-containing protein n=1 Tax=Planosporangium thailandense TaxID=765197 RepID=A0ABX0XSI5_9ACTN|nr:hypothetical protein [Planosporangium thailandense]
MPEFLADRDLGKRVVEALRAAGAVVHTLPEVFGEEGAQLAADTEWIAVAGRYGWVALSKNKRIRYVTAEREALAAHGVPLRARQWQPGPEGDGRCLPGGSASHRRSVLDPARRFCMDRAP